MEKRSKHYGDVSKWIEKVIESCETFQQTIVARKLVSNFRKQLLNTTPDKYWRDYQYDFIWSLENKLTVKRDSLRQ